MIMTVANAAGRFGIKPKEAERFIKFATVGLIGFVVDFGVFNLLRWLAVNTVPSEELLPYFIAGAQTISFMAAITSNFTWNRYWTYPDSRSKSFRRQFVQFALVNFSAILVRLPLFWFTHEWFGRMVEQLTAFETSTAVALGDNLSVAFAVSIVMFWNFFMNRYWTYNDVA